MRPRRAGRRARGRGDLAAGPAGRRSVAGALHLHAAVEVHLADAEGVVTKRRDREWPERRLLLCEHRGDLALGRAVDAGGGPALLPAIQVITKSRVRLYLPVSG